MSKKVVNIDDILGQNALEIQVKGRSYTVKDFMLSEFLEVMSKVNENDPKGQQDALRHQLAKAFECDPEELNDLGLKTMMTIFIQIRDWIVGEAETSLGGDAPSNP